MKNKLMILLLLIGVISCNIFFEKGIDFKIINKSSETLKQVKFTTSEKFEIVSFEKMDTNQILEGFLSMKRNNIDGDYIIEFTKQDNSKVFESFGYYTNGSPLEDCIEITILNDTIITKFKESSFY